MGFVVAGLSPLHVAWTSEDPLARALYDGYVLDAQTHTTSGPYVLWWWSWTCACSSVNGLVDPQNSALWSSSGSFWIFYGADAGVRGQADEAVSFGRRKKKKIVFVCVLFWPVLSVCGGGVGIDLYEQAKPRTNNSKRREEKRGEGRQTDGEERGQDRPVRRALSSSSPLLSVVR